MYFLLAISLVFAFLLVLNLCASVSATLLWRLISRRASRLASRKQEQIIFALRAFPVGAALIFVLAFMLPAYVLYEPHGSGEIVSIKLAVISLISIAGIGLALYRVIGTWRSTRALTTQWLGKSRRIELERVDIPVYCLEHPFPVIAVVGTFRPRMFVASQIFESLTADEFQAAIAHEYGHLAAHDNFKRTFLKVCRDMLVLPLGRGLDRAWADNIESAADEYAASVGGRAMALDLAATLIKIARIVPENTSPAMPLASFILERHSGDLKRRIGRLLELSDQKELARVSPLRGRFASAILIAVLLTVLVPLIAWRTNLLERVHDVSETVVAILQ